jgi:hypothetical protein
VPVAPVEASWRSAAEKRPALHGGVYTYL